MRIRMPTTLRAQFVAVVAAAVIFSNLAVVVILEVAREGELRGARVSAAVDRISAIFDYLANISEYQRDSALRALSGNFLRYSYSVDPPFPVEPLTDEGRRIVTDLVSGERRREFGEVRIRQVASLPPRRPGDNQGPAIEIAQAVASGGWLDARFITPQAPSPAPEILLAAAFGTILTGAAAAWLAGRVSRPLSALAFAADAVARGRTAPRLLVQGPDDIRLAAEAFNEMSDRVARTLGSHRQLLSAVGHDLRTPIAAMRISAEFVDDADTRDRLTRNLDDLQSLTEAVLAAARARPGEESHRVDLAVLVESVCDDLTELDLPITVDVEGSAPCLCRPNEIRRAVRNLVENAVRYGKNARVSLRTEPDFFVVAIEDDGPGIPETRLEEVFEPFVRLEESRSTTTGGSGLGLTLTRSIAREHGGDVILENRYAGRHIQGLRASLRLPREKQRSRDNADEAIPVAPESAPT
jgi:signal transduction histidine kinase